MSGLLIVLALGQPGFGNSLMPFPESHFDTVDGVSVHYREWDAPRPEPEGSLLLVHGFAASTFSWRRNIETLLAAGYRVVAVDLPPYGYSDRRPGMDQSPQGRAELLWRLLDRIDMKSMIPGRPTTWHLVGHSMGGSVTLAMAIARPRRAATLTLVDPAIDHIPTEPQRMLVQCDLLRVLIERWARATIADRRDFTRMLAFAYGRAPDSATVDGYRAPLQRPGTIESVVDGIISSPRSASPDMENVQLPALIVWGADDRVVRPSEARRLGRVIPESALRIIPHSGHVPMETEPEAFNALLLDFLDRNAAKAGNRP